MLIRSHGTDFDRRRSTYGIWTILRWTLPSILLKQTSASRNHSEFLFKKFGSEPKGQMKEYFQIIHRLYPKIGLIETSRDFKYLGIYTSHKKPSASGTWFMLHYLSVKEMIKIEFERMNHMVWIISHESQLIWSLNSLQMKLKLKIMLVLVSIWTFHENKFWILMNGILSRTFSFISLVNTNSEKHGQSFANIMKMKKERI